MAADGGDSRDHAIASARRPLATALNGDAGPLIERFRNGESVEQIAASFDVAPRRVYGYLIRNAPEEWASATTDHALEKLEAAEARLEAATDQVEVSKARTAIDLCKWRLEKLCRKYFGEDKALQGAVTVNVVLDTSCKSELTIEQEAA